MGEVFRSTALARNEIEWALIDEVRLPASPWVLQPLGFHGWLCSRTNRLGRTRHFVVSADLRCARVRSDDPSVATETLSALTSP